MFFPSIVSLFAVVISLPVLQAKIPIQILTFCSGSLGAHQFYCWLISPLHRSACFIKWCCPFGYLFTMYLYFRFLHWLFPWSLRDDNVVFYSVMIFFINSIFIVTSCVNVCSIVLGVAFWFSLFCLSIRLEGSCFSVYSVSVRVEVTCWYSSLFICGYISHISTSEN